MLRLHKVVGFPSFNFRFIPYCLHYELQKQPGNAKAEKREVRKYRQETNLIGGNRQRLKAHKLATTIFFMSSRQLITVNFRLQSIISLSLF